MRELRAFLNKMGIFLVQNLVFSLGIAASFYSKNALTYVE
jgi:hypothetical protein